MGNGGVELERIKNQGKKIALQKTVVSEIPLLLIIHILYKCISPVITVSFVGASLCAGDVDTEPAHEAGDCKELCRGHNIHAT